jgi:hypothetical protein
MRRLILLTAAPLLLASAPAGAQASDQAWNNWVYRANSILRAIASGERREIEVMCRDIHRETAGKGFPKWATHLTTACEALIEGARKGTTGKFCRSARLAAAHLNAATPVPEEPRARRIGLELAGAMQGLHEGLCR